MIKVNNYITSVVVQKNTKTFLRGLPDALRFLTPKILFLQTSLVAKAHYRRIAALNEFCKFLKL